MATDSLFFFLANSLSIGLYVWDPPLCNHPPWTMKARPVLIAFAAYCTVQPVTQNNYNDTGPKSQ